MLQPLQLEDVSVRYVEEIAELRDFLVKTGSAVGTLESLGGIAARLQRDHAFRRDLTSHVWVVLHRRDRQISYADLLGLLAVAAAGAHFAAAAHPDDAHNLLRFLMEARHSFDSVLEQGPGTPERRAAEAAISLSTKPTQSAGAGQEHSEETQQPLGTDLPSLKMPGNIGGKHRRLIGVAAAGVLAALFISVWLHHPPAVDQGKAPAAGRSTATGSIAPSSSANSSDSPFSHRGSEAAATAGGRAPAVRSSSQMLPPVRTVRRSGETREAATFIPRHPAAPPPRAAAPAIHGPVPTQIATALQPPAGKKPPAASAPPGAALPVRPTAPGIPTATLSRRLGSPTLPTDTSAQGNDSDAMTPHPPRLLRRRPLVPSAAGDEAKLALEGKPPDVFTTPGTSRMTAAGATRGGIVRLTSLGTMAANVLYSPVPAYPVAASAENVQGEVKVRADVDRDGNVAAVHVISGPPLLRDAALDAVQRWRYRPYVSYGKPAPMTAIAIVDFQLP